MSKRMREETAALSKRKRVALARKQQQIAESVRQELHQELHLADEYVFRQRRRFPWAFSETDWRLVDLYTPEAAQCRRAIVDALISNCATPNTASFRKMDVVLMPALIYHDRLHLEMIATDPERASYRDTLGHFDIAQCATLCQFVACKAGDETQSVGSLAKYKRECPNDWPRDLAASPLEVEFALYGLLRWDVETRANAYQIAHLLVRHCGADPFEPVSANRSPLTRGQLAMLFCVLSAYDEALSPAFFPPVPVAVASVMLMLTATGQQPWNARLATLLGCVSESFVSALRWCLERLYDAWNAGPTDPRWAGCPWLCEQMTFRGLGCRRDSLGVMAASIMYY